MEAKRGAESKPATKGRGCLKTSVGVGLGLVLGAVAGIVVGLAVGIGIAMILGVL